MLKERRTESREVLGLPCLLSDGGYGMTRDISASGVFFETDWGAPSTGSVLELEFTLDSPSHCFRFIAFGSVMRTERQAGKSGVAVKVHATRMEVLA